MGRRRGGLFQVRMLAASPPPSGKEERLEGVVKEGIRGQVGGLLVGLTAGVVGSLIGAGGGIILTPLLHAVRVRGQKRYIVFLRQR